MTIVSSTPGRLRVNIDALKNNYKLAFFLERSLSSKVGILRFKINPLIGSLVIYYNSEYYTNDEIIELIDKLIRTKKDKIGKEEEEIPINFLYNDRINFLDYASNLFGKIVINVIREVSPAPLKWII